jgi:putative transposase
VGVFCRRVDKKWLQTNGNIRIIGDKIRLPKLGNVRFAKSVEVNGHILNATVKRTPSGKYFVSVLVETEVDHFVL